MELKEKVTILKDVCQRLGNWIAEPNAEMTELVVASNMLYELVQTLPSDLERVERLEKELREIVKDSLTTCEEMDEMMDNGEWADAHELANDTLSDYAKRIKSLLDPS